MAEGGIRDFRQAKLKTAGRLGIHDDASCRATARSRNAARASACSWAPARRSCARTGRALQASVLRAVPSAPGQAGADGTADANSPVTLQLHADDEDAVPRFLDEHGIPATARSRRLRLDRRSGDFPAWIFSAGDTTIDLTVLPRLALRQAPLSNIDEKPMRRASAAQLRRLLDEGDDLPS